MPIRCRIALGDPETTKIEGVTNFELSGQDVFFEIVEPEELSYTYRTRPAKDFGPNFNSISFRKPIRLVPVIPTNGCKTLENAHVVYDSVAFVERGECSFVSKAVVAEIAGARAVIIYDNVVTDDDFFTEMIDDQSGQDLNIPATFLFGKNGRMISSTLESLNMDYALINVPVNVSYVPLSEWRQPPWTQW